MKRIGIAASKMAKGNLGLYNLFVVLISFLFSLLVFVIAGLAILLAFLLIVNVAKGIVGQELSRDLTAVFLLCLLALSVVIGLFNLFAILVNIRLFRKDKI